MREERVCGDCGKTFLHITAKSPTDKKYTVFCAECKKKAHARWVKKLGDAWNKNHLGEQ